MKRFLVLYTILTLLFVLLLAALAWLGLSEDLDSGGTAAVAVALDEAGLQLGQLYAAARDSAGGAADGIALAQLEALSGQLDRAAAALQAQAYVRASVARGMAALTLFAAALGLVVTGLLWLVGLKYLGEPLAVLARRLDADLSSPLPILVLKRGTSEVRQLYAAFNELGNRLEDYRTQVQLAERETVGRYLVHEMKNLLTPIPLALAVLKPSSDAEACALIEHQAGEMSALLERFRCSYRFPAMQLAPCRLRPVIEGLAELRNPAVRLEWPDGAAGAEVQNTDVRAERPQQQAKAAAALNDECIIMADAHFLAQAVSNLLRNALDAVGSGVSGSAGDTGVATIGAAGSSGNGSAAVRGDGVLTGSQSGPPAAVLLRLSRSADRCLIKVADKGCGMSRETLVKIQNEWYTSKQKGMGLGLALARRIVLAHGGTLNIESEPGRGTQCTISLPLKQL